MKKLILTFSSLFIFISFIISQNNVWNGNTSNDWSEATNWSLGHVPLATEDVKSWTSTDVINVDVDAFAKSVTFQGDAITINTNNTLTIDGSAGIGFYNTGTGSIETDATLVINNSFNSGIRVVGAGASFSVVGILTIDGTTNNYGIRNDADFSNYGTINIDNTADNAINHNGTSTFYNQGSINIGLSGDIGGNGINIPDGKVLDNQWEINIGSASGTITNNGVFVNSGGTFNNNGAFLTIDYSMVGIMNSGTFTNEAGGYIELKSNISSYEIRNNSTFENKTDCTIDLRISPNSELYNASGILTNAGTMNFDGTSMAFPCIDNRVVIDNSGTINIDNSANQGLVNYAGAVIDNYGDINIAQSGGIASNGIENNGTINNYYGITIGSNVASVSGRGIIGSGSLVNDAGLIFLDNITQQALFNNGGSVTNTGGGEISIGTDTHCSHRGIENNGIFNNQTGSTITIEDVQFESIYLQSNIFTNEGTYNHLSIVSSYSIRDDGGSFINETTGVIFSKKIIGNTAGAVTAFTQKGTLNPGNSPGILEFNGGLTLESTATYNCEINGNGGAGAGDQDQIRVTNGDTDLGGSTLNLEFGAFTPADDDEFIVLEYAGALSGTFSTVNNLPAGWVIDYGVKLPGRVVIYGSTSEIPIKLLSFEAKAADGTVYLNWKTASEKNNDYFDIEHSYDGIIFNSIGKISGNRDSKEINSYSFTHNKPSIGINYYRLKQVDFDGGFDYSKIVNITIEGKEICIYPNPTSDFIIVNNVEDWSNVSIYDVKGAKQLVPKASENKLDISNLSKGIYTLKEKGKKAMKFIVK